MKKKLIEIGIGLIGIKDWNKLLKKILSEAIDITNADGGTLYLICDKGLKHKIMQNKSMKIDKGAEGEQIDFLPIDMSKRNIAAYSALERQVVNIKDVYNSELFDFSGPREFDEMTGYKTKSMLVFPLLNRRSKVVGVLQLINSLDHEGNVIPFEESFEEVVLSLASQAGLSIENMQYMDEVRHLFESFVKVVIKTIDERTPYNSEHSENISVQIQSFAKYLNTCNQGPFKDTVFSEEAIYELKTAAWLHDIGKIVVPLNLLDKSTRLSQRYEPLMSRYDLIQAKIKWHYYEEKLNNNGAMAVDRENKYAQDIAYIEEIRAYVTEVNHASTFVDDGCIDRLKAIHAKVIEDIEEPLLTREELEDLSIVRGTLTAKERESIEGHVSSGARILSKMHFPEYLQKVNTWIYRHHEFLDGSGYPEKLKAEDIPLESRMMTILDIYDALVERNRPYKEAIPKTKALDIIKGMAKDNQLDQDLVDAFIDSQIWDVY